ncbi:MAG TPA: hypothetical protein VM432_06420 [Bdellovibrionales bacterium]|nr:hypothetical protein [Bdellovibrionales bacterium]
MSPDLSTVQMSMPELSEPELLTAQEVAYTKALHDLFSEMPSAKPPSIDDDTHFVSETELEEGAVLARIRTLALTHPQYKSATQKVYSECAEHTAFGNSVRAMCFYRSLELATELGNAEKIISLSVPLDIRELASKLLEST